MEIKNPVKAIRAKCLNCCCGSSNEVKLCPVNDCALWPFRFGKNPYRTQRVLTEEQRKAGAEHLRRYREQKNNGGL